MGFPPEPAISAYDTSGSIRNSSKPAIGMFIMSMLSFKDREAAAADVLLIIYMLLNNKITTSAEEKPTKTKWLACGHDQWIK
ncbi:hypothetical protein WN944_014648 [Citrus x changshan-huyou]|uniref:Uncharacterized protein n=1 Tax=Citrus x changshan-huyou TaxID=2935761 RepID=A0AAP0M7H1_9ROSI